MIGVSAVFFRLDFAWSCYLEALNLGITDEITHSNMIRACLFFPLMSKGRIPLSNELMPFIQYVYTMAFQHQQADRVVCNEVRRAMALVSGVSLRAFSHFSPKKRQNKYLLSDKARKQMAEFLEKTQNDIDTRIEAKDDLTKADLATAVPANETQDK